MQQPWTPADLFRDPGPFVGKRLTLVIHRNDEHQPIEFEGTLESFETLREEKLLKVNFGETPPVIHLPRGGTLGEWSSLSIHPTGTLHISGSFKKGGDLLRIIPFEIVLTGIAEGA